MFFLTPIKSVCINPDLQSEELPPRPGRMGQAKRPWCLSTLILTVSATQAAVSGLFCQRLQQVSAEGGGGVVQGGVEKGWELGSQE